MSQLAKRALPPARSLQKSSINSRWFIKSPKSSINPSQTQTWLQSNLLRIRNPVVVPKNNSPNQFRCNPASGGTLNFVRNGANAAGTGGKGFGKETFKSRRPFLLTALQDSGSRLSDRTQILRPVVFTAFVAGTAFVGSTIWQYENYKHTVAKNSKEYLYYGLLRRRSGDTENKRFNFRDKIYSLWNNASLADKIFWPICILNGLVFLAWRIPSLTPTMVTYFTATPVSRAVCLPMILSTFSHYSFYHLAANMFVLHSFLPAATSLMGKENFLGLYFTAGAISSLGSHLHKIFIGSNVPSLGASGAIMGILALVCTRMPDIQLGIIFIPGLSFSASTAMKSILTIDTVGLLAGWKFMDHAAHLSGAICGISYAYFEHQLTPLRESILNSWHEFRTGK